MSIGGDRYDELRQALDCPLPRRVLWGRVIFWGAWLALAGSGYMWLEWALRSL